MGHYECRKCDQRFDLCTCARAVTVTNIPSCSPASPRVVPCSRCGMVGAHFCPGPMEKRWQIEEGLRDFFELLTPRCRVHRRYGAKRRPRTACEACWRLWIALHPA